MDIFVHFPYNNFMITLNSSLTKSLVSFHQYQHSSNDCGPYCTATVLSAFQGSLINANLLARQMEKIGWAGIFPVVRRFPHWATFPWGVQNVLSQNGIRSKFVWKVSISQLLNFLTYNIIPITIIGEFHPLWAHYKILVAAEPGERWGFVDPAYPEQSITWQPHNQFMTQWKTYGQIVIKVFMP